MPSSASLPIWKSSSSSGRRSPRRSQDAAAAGRADSGGIARLTRRERDVMVLLVQGLTNKGIARAMVISENTVKRYLKSIFAKLDVDSRAAAVAKALGSGSRMS